MIARTGLFMALVFSSSAMLGADPPPAPERNDKSTSSSGLRKAMSESQKRDARAARAPALAGKGLARRPARRR
jgi:hypothetical protein